MPARPPPNPRRASAAPSASRGAPVARGAVRRRGAPRLDSRRAVRRCLPPHFSSAYRARCAVRRRLDAAAAALGPSPLPRAHAILACPPSLAAEEALIPAGPLSGRALIPAGPLSQLGPHPGRALIAAGPDLARPVGPPKSRTQGQSAARISRRSRPADRRLTGRPAGRLFFRLARRAALKRPAH